MSNKQKQEVVSSGGSGGIHISTTTSTTPTPTSSPPSPLVTSDSFSLLSETKSEGGSEGKQRTQSWTHASKNTADSYAASLNKEELTAQLAYYDKAIKNHLPRHNLVLDAASSIKHAAENNPKLAAAGLGFLGMYAAFNAKKMADSGLAGADHGTMILSALTVVLLAAAVYLASRKSSDLSSEQKAPVSTIDDPTLKFYIGQRNLFAEAIKKLTDEATPQSEFKKT